MRTDWRREGQTTAENTYTSYLVSITDHMSQHIPSFGLVLEK